MQRRSLMENPNWIFFSCIASILLIRGVQSKLSVIKECGDLVCSDHQFCSSIDHSCRNCNEICNSENNNYDIGACGQNCQDFLHDVRYTRRSAKALDEIHRMALYRETLEDDLSTLKLLSGFVLLSVIIMTTLLSIILIYILKARKGVCDLTAKTAPNDFPIIYNKHCQKDDTPPVSISVETKNYVKENIDIKSLPTPKRTASNCSKFEEISLRQRSLDESKLCREPSESTLPEYVYDNPTLVPSPVHHI